MQSRVEEYKRSVSLMSRYSVEEEEKRPACKKAVESRVSLINKNNLFNKLLQAVDCIFNNLNIEL